MYLIRTLLELTLFAALAGGLLVAVFVAGQWAKLADLLGTAGDWGQWSRLMSLAALALVEAALPLVGLIAAGLVYGRRRMDGALLGYSALGWSPWRVYGPTFVFGAVCAVVAAWLAASPVPQALVSMGRLVTDMAVERTLDAQQGIVLPQGAVLRAESDAGPFWLALTPKGSPPTLIRAEAIEGAVEESITPFAAQTSERGRPLSLNFDARNVWVWTHGMSAHVGRANLALGNPELGRRVAMLGPPNSLPSIALDRHDVHHQFTWHRRLSMPLMAPLWALLGGLLGGFLGGVRALVVGAGVVTLAYWILRTGELAARAGFGSAAFAAWAPCLLLFLGVYLIARRL